MIENEELKGTTDTAAVYEYIKQILAELDERELRLVKTGAYIRLDKILPRAKELIRKQLNVRLLELRAEIREQLDKDEREQLKLPEPAKSAEEKTEEPAAGIPKNDYRRHQNGSEEDGGK